jgi:LacI family transcriptional regulator
MKRATMAEVARLAGVGTMTVSRVLNDSTNVQPKTASRVREAIERLGYRPNEFARGLRGAKSRSIGLIVPSLVDPFFATCAHSVNAVAQSQGYSMILTTSNHSIQTEYNEAAWMLEKHVEGIVICPTPAKHSKLSNAIFHRTPIVSFDRPLGIPRVASVVVENSAGARRLTEHLIEHGHKRIHFLGDSPNLFTIKTRVDGYRRALSTIGSAPRVNLEIDSQDAVTKYLKEVMAERKPPTAFIAGNNWISRYLYRAITQLGLRIPEDVATVGFDDFDLADMLQPPLTVVNQPVELLGTIAAEVLFSQLKLAMEDRPEVGGRTVLKVDLIVRASCGCQPVPEQSPHTHGTDSKQPQNSSSRISSIV